MDYPKYIEYADGTVVIFSPILTHSHVAGWYDQEAVSAGMACFPTLGRQSYKFFGVSTTLGLSANKNLVLENPTWYGGVVKGDDWKPLVFSTTPSVVADFEGGNEPLTLIGLQDEYDTVAYLPAVEGVSDLEIARFSGLLECSPFGQPVRRVASVSATAASDLSE